MVSSLPAIATEWRLDEEGKECCSGCSEDEGSAGAAKVDVDDDTASVAKISDELDVIFMGATI